MDHINAEKAESVSERRDAVEIQAESTVRACRAVLRLKMCLMSEQPEGFLIVSLPAFR